MTDDERPRLSVVKGGGDLHGEAMRLVQDTPPLGGPLHPSRRVDDTDSDKLSRVTALLNKWERMAHTMASVDDRELLMAAIDSLRSVIAMPDEGNAG